MSSPGSFLDFVSCRSFSIEALQPAHGGAKTNHSCYMWGACFKFKRYLVKRGTSEADPLNHLAPGGSLHIVDFGDHSGYPAWFQRAATAWIARFHVTQRSDFVPVVEKAAAHHGCTARIEHWYRNYAWAAVIKKPAV